MFLLAFSCAGGILKSPCGRCVFLLPDSPFTSPTFGILGLAPVHPRLPPFGLDLGGLRLCVSCLLFPVVCD